MATVDNLAAIVLAEMENFRGLLEEDIVEAQKAAAKAAIRQIRETAPKKTGEYAKSWKSKTIRKGGKSSTTIYSGRYYLAHLLENGHPIKTKGGQVVGRAKKYPHLAAAEETAQRLYEEELMRRVENDT